MSRFNASALRILRTHALLLCMVPPLALTGCSETVDTTTATGNADSESAMTDDPQNAIADQETPSTADADATPSDTDSTADTTTADTTTAVDIPHFTPEGHVMEDLESVRKRLENNEAVLIDVREQNEWDEGHLSIASLVPLSELNQDPIPAEVLDALPRDKPIYVHCRSGGRVLLATEVLKPKGFDIRPLKSGFDDLVAAGFERQQ